MLPKIRKTYKKTFTSLIMKVFLELILCILRIRLSLSLRITIKFNPKKVLINEIPKLMIKRKKFVVPINTVIGKASRITIIGMSKFLKIVRYITRFNFIPDKGSVLNHSMESDDIKLIVSIIVINRKLKNWSKKKILYTMLLTMVYI